MKIIYKEIRNRNITPPTAQLKYNAQYVSDKLDWKNMQPTTSCCLGYKIGREFQYKFLNRCLVTNVLFCKIGIISSPVCSFCGEVDECFENIVTYHHSKKFWAEVIKWISGQPGYPNCTFLLMNGVYYVIHEYRGHLAGLLGATEINLVRVMTAKKIIAIALAYCFFFLVLIRTIT